MKHNHQYTLQLSKKKLQITNTKMKYRHKDPIFLEIRTFTKY
jgi:hypothetical protein